MAKYLKIKPKYDDKKIAWGEAQDPYNNFNQWCLVQEAMVTSVFLSEYEKQKKEVLEAFDNIIDDLLLDDLRKEMKSINVFIKKTFSPDTRGTRHTSFPTVFFRRTTPVQTKKFFEKASKKYPLFEITKPINGEPYAKLLNKNMKDSLKAGGGQALYEFGVHANFQMINPKIIEWGENYNATLSKRLTETLSDNIKFEILEGLQNFETIEEIRDRVYGVFDEPLIVQMPAQVRPDGTVARRAHERHITSKQWATWVARSETIRWAANGKVMAYKQTGVVTGVIFTATGDHRTCEDCMVLHGTLFTLDDSIGVIPIHCQGRCTWVPEVREMPDEKLDAIAYENIMELYGLAA